MMMALRKKKHSLFILSCTYKLEYKREAKKGV